MSHKDWDPDDFLDFDYGKPVPGGQRNNTDNTDEHRQYEELRRQSRQSEQQSAGSAGIEPPLSAQRSRQKKKAGGADMSKAETDALKRAQQEAYDRYRRE
jgi:hypothetical protein